MADLHVLRHSSLWPQINLDAFSSNGKNISALKKHMNVSGTVEKSIPWSELKPREYSACEGGVLCKDGAPKQADIKVVKQLVLQPMSCAKAHVTSHSTYLESSASSHDFKNKKALLLSIVKSHDGFLKAIEKKAIEFMLDKDQSVDMIDMASAFLYVKFGHAPTGNEVFKAMLDCDLQENVVIKQFSDFIETEPGKLALEPLLQSSSSGQEEPEHQSTNNVLIESQRPSPDSPTQELSSGTSSHGEEDEDSNAPDSSDNDAASNIIKSDKPSVPAPMEIEPCTSRDDMLKLKRALIEKENAILKNRLLCRLCKQRPVSVVLLPCGHFVLCNVCSEPCRVCPCCQAVVLAEKKTFLG